MCLRVPVNYPLDNTPDALPTRTSCDLRQLRPATHRRNQARSGVWAVTVKQTRLPQASIRQSAVDTDEAGGTGCGRKLDTGGIGRSSAKCFVRGARAHYLD